MAGAHIMFKVTWIVDKTGLAHIRFREASFVSRLSIPEASPHEIRIDIAD